MYHGDLELNPGPSTPFLNCPKCLKEISIKVKICSCGHNMCKRSKTSAGTSQIIVSDIPTTPQCCSSQNYSAIGLMSQFPSG